jgi:hypothetical protein
VEVVDTAKAVKINGVQVWLSHYAIDLPYPILSVHGHIHEAEYQSDGMINLSLDSDYMQTRRFGAPISFDELTPLLVARQKKIAERYQIESENKRYDRLIERAFDETITINKPTANQRHELALLVDYLNTNELTYADVLKAFNIPNEDKVLSNQEKEKVALTGFEFEKKINLQGNIGEKMTEEQHYQLADFDYDLPETLIAQTPLKQRDSSRLLVLDADTGLYEDKHFYDILDYVNPGDAIVMNNSRVLPARLHGVRPETGGHAEVLLLRQDHGDVWETLVKPAKKITSWVNDFFW